MSREPMIDHSLTRGPWGRTLSTPGSRISTAPPADAARP